MPTRMMILACFVIQAKAATDTYIGPGTLSAGTSWADNTRPTTTDEALFTGSLPSPITTAAGTNLEFGNFLWNSNSSSTVALNTTGTTSTQLRLTNGAGSTAAVANGGASNDLILLGTDAVSNTLSFDGNLGTGSARLELFLYANGNFNVVNPGATLEIATRLREQTDNPFGFTKTGNGTLVLSGTNTYSGGTTLTQGVLALRNSSALGSGPLTINGGTIGSIVSARTLSNNVTINGDFQLGGVIVGLLTSQPTTFNGTVDLGGATRTITLGNSAMINGVVSNGGLTIGALDNYTFTLAGNSTYAGATTVNGGTLRINGDNTAATGAITVAAGAALGGNGISGAAVSIDANGGLSARITDWTGAAGTGYDDLQVAGLNIAGALTVVINTSGMVNFTEVNKSFTILNSGGITVFNPASVTISAPGFAGIGTWSLAQSGSSLVLNYAAGVADPFLTWIGPFAVSDPSKGADPENDGIKNLMEFVLNGNPGTSDPEILPDTDLTATDFTFTFTRREDSKGVDQLVQYGSTLTAWTNVAIPDPVGSHSVGAATVVVGTPSGGLETVTVTIPRPAGGDKLFARLVVGP